MRLLEYQELALKTDHIPWKQKEGAEIALLGIIGELGSVSATLKKHLRDGDAYTQFKGELTEELGDLLWYIVIVANRLGMKLDYEPSQEFHANAFSALKSLYSSVNSLLPYQDTLTMSSQHYTEEIWSAFQRILDDINSIASNFCTNIFALAEYNARKTPQFWAGDTSVPARCFDAQYPEYEQLPRFFQLKFIQAKGRRSSIIQLNDVNIGDRLTDNSYVDDGYRYHDVFHIAHVATLGWSPVTRRILNAKRKSAPDTDEVEDGARAAIVEELVVNRIFDYVRDHEFMKSTEKLDFALLKSILALVRDLEVSIAEPWEWKHCILEGCRTFRQLRKHRQGTVSVDCERRSIKFIAIDSN